MSVSLVCSRNTCIMSGSKQGRSHKQLSDRLRCAAFDSRANAHANEGHDVLWVFAAEPPRGSHYSMLDVRDAVEACSTARTQDEREQCFLNFGLKASAVDKYYESVVKLEDSMQEPVSDEDALAQRMVRVAGFFLFLAVGCRMV